MADRASDRVAFLRPVNTAAITDAMIVGDQGGTHVHVNVAAGTYWHIGALLRTMQETVRGTFASATFTMKESDGFLIHFHPGSSQEVVFDDAFTALTRLDDSSSSTEVIAGGTPPSLWVSAYAPSDQIGWVVPQGTVWSGSTALDGNTSGSMIGEFVAGRPTAYGLMMERTINLSYEPAASVFADRADTNNDNAMQSLELFMLMSRCATCVGNFDAACTGFHFFPSASDVQNTTYWDCEPSKYNGPGNKYQFATISTTGTGQIVSAIPSGRSHYNVSLRIRAARQQTGWLKHEEEDPV